MQNSESLLKRYFRLFFTGFGMGAADLVPGVSGGTIAFVFGIYEELMQSIKTLSGVTLQLALRGKIKEAWETIPFGFLIPLAAGLGTAVVGLASLIKYLLEFHTEYVWSFFFGLVVASIILVSRKIKTWDWYDIGLGLVGAVAAYIIVGAVPVETPAHPVLFFIAGFIAICAMILPGISGSFLLVIMGKYEQILTAVTQQDFVTIGLVGVGAVLGLALFARLLSWMFKYHHDLVIAILTGFMVGSLRKIWPWKEVITSRISSDGHVVPVVEHNILPAALDSGVLFAVFLAVAGVAFMLVLEKYSPKEK